MKNRIVLAGTAAIAAVLLMGGPASAGRPSCTAFPTPGIECFQAPCLGPQTCTTAPAAEPSTATNPPRNPVKRPGWGRAWHAAHADR